MLGGSGTDVSLSHETSFQVAILSQNTRGLIKSIAFLVLETKYFQFWSTFDNEFETLTIFFSSMSSELFLLYLNLMISVGSS